MARSTKDLQSRVCGNCASAREDLCRNENCLNQRTQWARRYVEEFLGLALLREFVLRSPRTIDRTEKEVATHLILHGQGGILLSRKCQEDLMARDETKTQLWARKNSKGALRAGPKPTWCDHPRRGRVEFPEVLPAIARRIVLTKSSSRSI